MLDGKSYVILSKEELKAHISVIQKYFNTNYRQVKPILDALGEKFTCERIGEKYILYNGDQDPRMKSKPMRRKRSMKRL